MTDQTNFDYVNLNEVDPNDTLVDTGVYTIEVSNAEKKTFTYKSGKSAGEEGFYYNFRLTVVDDAKFAGTSIFTTLFPSNGTSKQLRRLMDAVGIQQKDGESVTDWLTNLKNERVRFKAPVQQVPDVNKDGVPNPRTVLPDGSPKIINKVDLWNPHPVS